MDVSELVTCRSFHYDPALRFFLRIFHPWPHNFNNNQKKNAVYFDAR